MGTKQLYIRRNVWSLDRPRPSPSTPWSLLPAKELGWGSATTCWQRLDE
jgi:hypothetical protein